MKKRMALMLAAAWLLHLPAAHAAVDMAKGDALAKANNCTVCHGIDKKLVGPAYRDVANKYRGDKQAAARLFKKVKEGGGGVWGAAAMPPNGPKVSDADIKALVEWVLAH